MSRHRNALTNEKGFALFYMAVFLTVLLIFVGLAVDTGRAYVVQAQLSKAVDGAALGAARMLNSGNPRQEAANIYRRELPQRLDGDDLVDESERRRLLHDDDRRRDRRQRRQRPRHGGRADDVHEAGEFPGADGQRPRARRRAAWSICRSCSTSRARSAGGGRACATRRARSSMPSTPLSDRISPHLLLERRAGHRCRCPPAAASTRRESWPTSPTAARRQHVDGRGPLSRLGRAAIGAERPAVGLARHRALHRRRVEQRAGHLPGIGDVEGTPHGRLPEADPGSRQHDACQPGYQRALRHPERELGSRLSFGRVCLELHDRLSQRAIASVDELPLVPPERRHSDVVSARQQLSDG